MSAIGREGCGLMRWLGYSFFLNIKVITGYLRKKIIIESRKNERIMEQSPWVGGGRWLLYAVSMDDCV